MIVRKRQTKGSKVKLNVFIPKFDKKERVFRAQVSASESVFLEYIFRMSLCELFKQITRNNTFLVIETSEGAFDVSNVKIIADTIAKYYSKDNNLLVISNLSKSDFLKTLIKRSRDDISSRILNYLKIGNPSDSQSRDIKTINGVFNELTKY